jgi:hypothetical protein
MEMYSGATLTLIRYVGNSQAGDFIIWFLHLLKVTLYSIQHGKIRMGSATMDSEGVRICKELGAAR